MENALKRSSSAFSVRLGLTRPLDSFVSLAWRGQCCACLWSPRATQTAPPRRPWTTYFPRSRFKSLRCVHERVLPPILVRATDSPHHARIKTQALPGIMKAWSKEVIRCDPKDIVKFSRE